MSVCVNSQSNWSEHTNSFFAQKTVLVLAVASSVDPNEMMHHAAFLLGLHFCQITYLIVGSSVVECLTRDQEAAGSSLTKRHCVVVLEQDTFILA